MSAIRLARGFTGRNFVIKFEGCYHGHADALLVKAGSGVATFGIPGSAGVPAETAQLTLALPFNDLAAVEAAFAARPDEIACVIVEPVVGNAGTIPPAPGYPRRAAAAVHGARRAADPGRGDDGLSSRRWAARSSSTAIDPDLTTLGKIVGGGLPVRRVRRPRGRHGHAGAARAGLPGRNAERESAGDGRGDRDARLSDRA